MWLENLKVGSPHIDVMSNVYFTFWSTETLENENISHENVYALLF